MNNQTYLPPPTKFEEYANYIYSKIDEDIVSKKTRGTIIRNLQDMRNQAENIELLFKENPTIVSNIADQFSK